MLTTLAYRFLATTSTLVTRAAAVDQANDPRYVGLDDDLREALSRIDEFGPYGYRPLLSGAIVFCIVFGLAAIVTTYQSIRARAWWLLYTLAFGAWCECVGNGIRIYGHYHPQTVDPYIAQQVILVLTPALFAATHYSIISKICNKYGPAMLLPLRVKWLIPVFCVLDVASLAVQATGSALAAIDETNNELVSKINDNGDIVVAGLCVQLVGYLAFNALLVTFVVRAKRAKRRGEAPWFDARLQTLIGATFASALLVLGRSAFRTAEMILGWVGEVSTTEWYYLIFDASLVFLAVLCLAVVSPAAYLPSAVDNTPQVQHEKGTSSARSVASASDVELALPRSP